MSFTRLEQLGPTSTSAWRARVDQTGAIVVVKPVPEELVRDASGRGRLDRLLMLSANLRTPLVARLFSYGPLEGGTWLAREYVTGTDLERHACDRGPIPWSQAAPIIRGIATALAALHGAGIAHLDLKPENVILGPGGFTVLTDYGVGAAPGIAANDLYRAPEGAVDFRSDFYSLGAIGAMLVTGVPGGLRLDGLPAEARPLFAWLLRTEPRARPGNATDVLLAMDGRLGIPDWGIMQASLPEAGSPDLGRIPATFEQSYGSLFGAPSAPLFGSTSAPLFDQPSGPLFGQVSAPLFTPPPEASPGAAPLAPAPPPAPETATPAFAPSAAVPGVPALPPPPPGTWQPQAPAWGVPPGWQPNAPSAWGPARKSSTGGIVAGVAAAVVIAAAVLAVAVIPAKRPTPSLDPSAASEMLARFKDPSFQFSGSAVAVVGDDSGEWMGMGRVAMNRDATWISIDDETEAGPHKPWQACSMGVILYTKSGSSDWVTGYRSNESFVENTLRGVFAATQGLEAVAPDEEGLAGLRLIGPPDLDMRMLGLVQYVDHWSFDTTYTIWVEDGEPAMFSMDGWFDPSGRGDQLLTFALVVRFESFSGVTIEPPVLATPTARTTPSATETTPPNPATPGPSSSGMSDDGLASRALATLAGESFQFSGKVLATGILGPFDLAFAGSAMSKGGDSAVSLTSAGGDGVLLIAGDVVCVSWCYHRSTTGDWTRSPRNPNRLDAFSTLFRSLADLHDEGEKTWNGRALHRLTPRTYGQLDPSLFGFESFASYTTPPEVTSLAFWFGSDGTPAGMSLDIQWVEGGLYGVLNIDITFERLSGVTIVEPAA